MLTCNYKAHPPADTAPDLKPAWHQEAGKSLRLHGKGKQQKRCSTKQEGQRKKAGQEGRARGQGWRAGQEGRPAAVQYGLLADQAHMPPQPLFVIAAHIPPVQAHSTRSWQVEALHQLDYGGFAATAGPHQRHHLRFSNCFAAACLLDVRACPVWSGPHTRWYPSSPGGSAFATQADSGTVCAANASLLHAWPMSEKAWVVQALTRWHPSRAMWVCHHSG